MKLKPPYIIAEIGVNFYDIARSKGITPIEAARLMIREAKNAGADAAKFQSYKADKIVSRHARAYWDRSMEPTASQYELFKKYDHFGPKEYRVLARYCRSVGIDFLSTPFDLEAVDFLNPLVSSFKVSSSDITNFPLLKRIAAKKKPIFLSSGASTIAEIEAALDAIRGIHPRATVTILHCVLSYPTPVEYANLFRIPALKEIFRDCGIGYSDHVRSDSGMAVVTAAWLLGATIIEKHFTLDKNLKGNDHFHAMDPRDLRLWRENIRTLTSAASATALGYQSCEVESRKQARRSIILKRNMKKGERIQERDLIMKRPGTGIPPGEIAMVVGSRLRKNLPADTILLYNHLDS